MEFLMRDDVNLSAEQWQSIDSAVIQAARNVLVGRKFLQIYGPLGAGAQSVNVDVLTPAEKGSVDFFGEEEEAVKVTGRSFKELPMIYRDFVLSWRDMEQARQIGMPIDLGAVSAAANACAQKEDLMIFAGNPKAGYEGLATAEGAFKVKKSDWSKDENAFSDVVKGLQHFADKNLRGRYALAVSPDLYAQLQRLQVSTGLLESERIKTLVGGGLYMTPALGLNKAVLVCAEPQNMDLVIGQDLITGYMGSAKLNHEFRVFETALLLIKCKDAVVVFG